LEADALVLPASDVLLESFPEAAFEEPLSLFPHPASMPTASAAVIIIDTTFFFILKILLI